MARFQDSLETYLREFLNSPLNFLFQVIQYLLSWVLSPDPPKPGAQLSRPKIAVVGAGLTGVASAAHCVGHGFDVHIFEAGSEDNLGGIWARVNSTSGLQIHSIMYRFFPSIQWSSGYPSKDTILKQVRQIWETYGLNEKTSFNTRVEKVYKDPQGRYIINNESNGRFDGVLACVGTCGDAKMPTFKGQDNFKGQIFHSSELDGKKVEGKRVIVIGGGASAIEAMQFVSSNNAKKTTICARSEKWIIPRNPVIDVLLSLNIFGAETSLSWIPEKLLRLFFYRDLEDIAPPEGSSKGLFTDTPMVNNDVLEQIRDGKAEWLRGDPVRFQEQGLLFNHREQGAKKGDQGREKLIEADTVIMATGFERPTLKFLPSECFEEPYNAPNWYLQVFPPSSQGAICATNCTYEAAIGTVGNYHIGIYTRFLLMFLVDPLARPTEWLMKLWIDFTRWVKARAPAGAFEFFTYAELLYWFVFVILINPFRWKWAFFVLFGIGSSLPKNVVLGEDKLRDAFGLKRAGVHKAEKKLS